MGLRLSLISCKCVNDVDDGLTVMVLMGLDGTELAQDGLARITVDVKRFLCCSHSIAGCDLTGTSFEAEEDTCSMFKMV